MKGNFEKHSFAVDLGQCWIEMSMCGTLEFPD